MKVRKKVLALSIVAALGVVGSANAQDAQTTSDTKDATTTTELDKVVVTGIRGSLQQALDAKREADAIVDAITAEDVGKFPSTNVAEAMTIIPGVTIDKAFGQGEKVSILGTDPALNRTLLNGQTIASADWFIADQPGRTFNYSLLAPQLVGKVEVFKSAEARLDEGSIGGTVIVHTRKPLDLDANTVSGQVSLLRNDRVKEDDPQVSLMYSWKNKADTFGFLIAGQKTSENIRRDGVESYGSVSALDYRDGAGGGGSVNNLPTDWSVPANPDGSQPTKPATCVGACASTLENNLTARGPNSLSAHYFEQERKRDTYSIALQLRPSDSFEAEFNALKVKAGYDNMSHSMFAFMGNAWNGLMKMTDVTIEDGVITKGTFDNALVVYDLINRRATVETDAYDLKLRWYGERWFASAELGTSEATGGTGQQVFGEFLNWSDYSYDISAAPGQPGSVTFHGSNPFLDPSAFQMDGGWGADPSSAATWNPGWGGNIVFKPTGDKERYGQLDFGVNMDGALQRLRFGYKQRSHETAQVMGGVSLAAVAGYGNATADQFDPRPLPGNYLDGFSGVGDLNNRFTIDGWALADYILSGDWLAPWQTMPEPSTFNDPSFAANTWTIEEDIRAAYVQADFEMGALRGNVGVRYVQTESDSGSWACTVNVSPCPAASYAWTNTHKEYNDVLPSVNLRYDVNDEFVLRGSASKVIARPNYGDMSSYLWLGDQTLTGGGGNPDLDPYESNNFDLSAEWYFSRNSILAGSMFYRDIGSYILVATRPETHFNQAEQEDTVYQVARPFNAGSASVKGYSLAYQQSWDNGFGVVANYTYADGESDAGLPLPYNSKNQINVSPFYENERWTARITYNWRSKYFTNVDRGDELWTRDYTSLDATLGFKINDNLTVSLDGMNLLDEAYHSYATDERLTRGAYRTGRRYMATLRFQF